MSIKSQIASKCLYTNVIDEKYEQIKDIPALTKQQVLEFKPFGAPPGTVNDMSIPLIENAVASVEQCGWNDTARAVLFLGSRSDKYNNSHHNAAWNILHYVAQQV